MITAERFAGQRFAFGPRILLTEHLPAVASLIGRELGMAGTLLLAVGLYAGVHRRHSGVALLAGAAAGMLGMVLNLSGDLNGFITPVMVLLWPITALGLDAVTALGRTFHGMRRLATTAAFAAAVFVPVANVAHNYRESDQSGNTAPARFFHAAFVQLPDRAGVIAEDYFYDMGIRYMTLTGEAGPRRGIRGIPFDAGEVRAAASGAGGASGEPRRIFGFAGSASFFATEGLQFERRPLIGPSIADWIAAQPKGTVIVGASAFSPLPVDLSSPEHAGARPPGRPRSFETFALRSGFHSAAWRGGDEPVSLPVDGASLAGAPPFAGPIAASADARGARIQLAGEQLAATGRGIVLAVFGANGSFLRSEAFEPETELRMPFEEALYELVRETPCVRLVTGGWTDVTPALIGGSWVATLPVIGSITVETEAVAPPDGDVRAESALLLGDGVARTTVSAASAPDPESSSPNFAAPPSAGLCFVS